MVVAFIVFLFIVGFMLNLKVNFKSQLIYTKLNINIKTILFEKAWFKVELKLATGD